MVGLRSHHEDYALNDLVAVMLNWYGSYALTYEIVFHVDLHDTQDANTPAQLSDLWKSSTIRMDLLLGCMEAAKASLDYFLHLPDDRLLLGTIIDTTRAAYGALGLGKISLGAGLAYDSDIVREKSNIYFYFDQIQNKFENLRIQLGGPDNKNIFFHYKRVFSYTRGWFEYYLQQGGLVFDGSSGLRDAKDLTPTQMVDQGQEALLVKEPLDEIPPLPTALDGFWDEIMNDWSPGQGDVSF